MPAKIGRKAKIGRTQRSLLLKSKEKQKAEERDRLRKACETIRILALREKRKERLAGTAKIGRSDVEMHPFLGRGAGSDLASVLVYEKVARNA